MASFFWGHRGGWPTVDGLEFGLLADGDAGRGGSGGASAGWVRLSPAIGFVHSADLRLCGDVALLRTGVDAQNFVPREGDLLILDDDYQMVVSQFRELCHDGPGSAR